MKPGEIQDVGARALEIMKKHYVSPITGFMEEEPLLSLPKNFDDPMVNAYLYNLDAIANYPLHRLIREKKIRETVERLPLPPNPDMFSQLPRKAKFRAMLILAMLMHAYFRELYPYKNVWESRKDKVPKIVPPQLSIPLIALSKETGIEPSSSYDLYALWNHAKKDAGGDYSPDNLVMLISFTGSESENWFVAIHQGGVEVPFAPAIKELLMAELFCREEFDATRTENVAKSLTETEKIIMSAMEKAGRSMANVVRGLQRMPEHCDPRTYFDSIRMFYSIPEYLIFSGVEELEGVPLHILGETGGQSPFMHFLLAMLGIKHEDEYFPTMRKHMAREHRELIEFMIENSKIRSFALKAKEAGHVAVVEAYNKLVQLILDFRHVHSDELVQEYIRDFGETHGTGKPPLDWLRGLQEETKTYFIPV